MTPTIRDVIVFNAAADAYLKKFDPEARPRTKLGYACRRVMKQTDVLLSDYNESLEDLRVKHCLTEEGKDGKRGRILRDERSGYQFDADGMDAFNRANRELLKGKAKFDAYFATHVPDDLPPDIFDAMIGFTISEEMAEQVVAEPIEAEPIEAKPTRAGGE